MTKDNGNTMLVEPIELPTKSHKDIENIQSFLELTEGKRLTKKATCARLILESIPVYKKRMQRFIK